MQTNTKNEVLHYWNYFCSLCERLQNTTQYVNHSAKDDGTLKNSNVNSLEFQQIITLTAMEFENICKVICLEIDPTFNAQYADIKKLTKTILAKYPLIVQTEVFSDYQNLRPLANWGIYVDSDSKEWVKGLAWWNDYSDLKHQTFSKFNLATLDNAVNSLASLMVMELYLIQIKLGTIDIPLSNKCEYFDTPYPGAFLCSTGRELPDFDTRRQSGALIQGEALTLKTV